MLNSNSVLFIKISRQRKHGSGRKGACCGETPGGVKVLVRHIFDLFNLEGMNVN